MNNIDHKIKDAMAGKVVGRTMEIDKAVVLELYQRITADSLRVGLAYGSPVLTGGSYASHTVVWGRIDTTVREPNPEGDESPHSGQPLTSAAALLGFRLGETTDIAHSRPCARRLEEGHSRFNAPEGIDGGAAAQVARTFKGASTITRRGVT